LRVLVADDNGEIRSALRLALLEISDQWAMAQNPHEESPSASCTILEATCAAEVLLLLKKQDIDVVLLDWELPGFDAPGMLPEIGTLVPGCTVIAMSGLPEAREHSLQSGADYFVGRNDPPRILLDLLRGLWTSE
jgi:CheY-like chemotaxis protein